MSIEVVAHHSTRFNRFGIGRIAYIDETDLVVLPVPASSRGLILILEPVGADDEGITERPHDVVPVQFRAVPLIARLFQAGVEHAAVERAEVEFADDDRPVRSVGQRQLLDAVGVFVEADDVAEPEAPEEEKDSKSEFFN
ncbi:MAG: hypothetical protein HOC74_40895, partial [Gemmatimonadetes bacterium]|nr:hypothetical protein [Gemmatimonadota bacterium]